MGQKVSPVGMRVGVRVGDKVVRDWDSKWYADKDSYFKYLNQDIAIRKMLEKEISSAVISSVKISRIEETRLDVKAIVLNPGLVVGETNKTEELVKKIAKVAHLSKETKVNFTCEKVENPDLDATIVAKSIAAQLEARASFRMVQKKAIQKTMKAGAKGIKTSVSGRLGGADIARSEGYSEGVVPLHTLRKDIDFAIAEAMTTYGKLGVKVWICRGDALDKKPNTLDSKGV